MEANEYFIDGNENEIFITVNVSTPGIASSKISLTFPTLVTIKNKAKSKDGTGVISRTSIGKGENLVDCLIEIETDILLNLIPKENWDNCYKNLVITYYLEGGVDNQSQPFICEESNKNKSDSGKTISVNKYIFLIKK